METEQSNFDVIVVGAGISGIGAGHHLQEQCPNKSFVILEGRETFGGTWDLFRYPGIRSDSDMHTMGFRTKIQGVCMHRPNKPGYHRPGIFVIDDWR